MACLKYKITEASSFLKELASVILWLDPSCAPDIDLVLESGNILFFVIAVAIRGVFRDDLINRHASPLGDIQVADQLIPLLKAILPAIHLGITAAILVNAGTVGDAAR